MNRRIACCTLALSILLSVSPDALALDPVDGLNWCPDSRDCLVWSPSPGADHYNVYRGGRSQLPAVLEGTTDSCSIGTFAATTTGAFPDHTPQPGEVHWYLVGAVDDAGAENAGLATAGPRTIDSSGDCPTSVALVLNEVDYDSVGSDTAEFVEIHNPGSNPVELAGIVLILVNGSTQSEYERVELTDSGPSLEPGGHLVVGSISVQAVLPPGTPFAAFGSASNNIQNGAPDGIALFDTMSGTLLDAVSYEGSIVAAIFDETSGTYNLVEGSPTSVADSNTTTGSLCRLPDGIDTGDAATDWSFCSFLSPGGTNTEP